jgi:prolipoprotein diacylglyceryltransferase
MRFPVEFHVGSLVVPAHLVFESLGYLAGFRCFLWLRSRWGDALPSSMRYLVIAAAAVGAALGSRALSLAQNPPAHWARPGEVLAATGGKTIVGGLLGGYLLVEWTKRTVGEARRTGDLFVVPLCLGIAIGRVGCFLAGLTDHTYGNPTTLPWGVDFGDGTRRHPTQLYEIVTLGLIAAWALRARGCRGLENGDLFRGFVSAYCLFRFAIETIKPEPRPYLGLSAIQVACLVAIAGQGRAWPRFIGLRESKW